MKALALLLALFPAAAFAQDVADCSKIARFASSAMAHHQLGTPLYEFLETHENLPAYALQIVTTAFQAPNGADPIEKERIMREFSNTAMVDCLAGRMNQGSP